MKIINKGLTLAGTPPNAGYQLRIRDNIIEFSADDGTEYTANTAEPSINNWHHIVGVVDRANNQLKLYLDGNPVGTPVDISSLGNVDTNIPLAIGSLHRGAYGPTTEFFNGLIDEVRIYNRALTPEEIKALYEGGQTTLTLTKSLSPSTFQEGTPSTITITIKNTGSTPISNIKITDSLPSTFKLTSGSLTKTIPSLASKQSTTLQYSFEPYGIGTISLPEATANYQDEKGKSYTTKSKAIPITISAKDSDNDGLSDGQELQLGTDPNKPDTDGDGLNDNQEIALKTNPLVSDTDRDGIKDGFDKFPLDRDNDGIPDTQDPFPSIPQNYIYAGIGLLLIILLIIGLLFRNSRKKKKFSKEFYDNLNLQITPEKESYEIGSNVAFIISISNKIGDIISGKIESELFNPIELTNIRKNEVYREKINIKSKQVGTLIGTAKAEIKDKNGNKHLIKKSFEVEITPPRPKLELKLTQEKIVKPNTKSNLILIIRNTGKGNAENISLKIESEDTIEIGEYSVIDSLESNSMAKIQIPYTCLSYGEFMVRAIVNYTNGKQYSDYTTITLKTLQFKPQGKIQLNNLPNSMKISETIEANLSILNIGEDAMLNVTPSIEGLDTEMPVFSRIDPKKEVVFPIKLSFDSYGTKNLKIIIEYEDEIGKKYSISEERTITVKGLQLKPSIDIEIPDMVAGDTKNCKIRIKNLGKELIKDATLELLIDGNLIETKQIGDIKDEKIFEIPITPKNKSEVIINLKYRDILNKEYTYQERSTAKLKERTVFVTSASNYKRTWILYKVKIENKLPKPISDIRIKISVPDVFMIKESEKTISMLEPDSSRTVSFDIRPTGECGECKIEGSVNYYNNLTDKREEIEIPAKSVSIICPLLKIKEISEDEWRNITSTMIIAEENTNELEIPAEQLFKIATRVLKDMNMAMINPEVSSSSQLFNGVAKFYGEGVKGLKYAAQVEVIGGTKKSKIILKSWAEREDALTGFYYKILEEIKKRTNIKDYIDKQGNVQYITIKDSVVQRSEFGK